MKMLGQLKSNSILKIETVTWIAFKSFVTHFVYHIWLDPQLIYWMKTI